MIPVVVWFRRDLRLADNPALGAAVASGAPILAVYIHSPDEEAPWQPGAATRWWLHHSLAGLARRLRDRGLQLHCLRGNARVLLPRLVAGSGAQTVFANRLYEPGLHARDQDLAGTLGKSGCRVRLFESGLFYAPGTLLNKQGEPYRVFTPFWRAVRKALTDAMPPPLDALPNMLSGSAFKPDGAGGVDSLGLLNARSWHEKLHLHWRPGEEAARERLELFTDAILEDYAEQRDLPARDGTSRLSPHLHFGEITPRAILRTLLPHLDRPGNAGKSVERFLAELGWREFAHHVLWHFPQTAERNMNPRFSDTFWLKDERALAAWRRGRTGIALVDAGMRQLWETGWMHNRVRMVVGSLLTKNLGVHWREGARWFWDTLVDADLANNSLGWQWIAGCGVDAAPYYRIFNPDTQAARFDPDGVYVARWSDGASSPAPIVDLRRSRAQALARYQNQPHVR